MNDVAPAAILVAVTAAVALGIAVVRKFAWSVRLADNPNSRSLHDAPRLRVGGLILVPVVLACASWLAPGRIGNLVLPCALVFAVSLADDLQSRSVAARLAVHALAAFLAVVPASPAGLAAAVAIVWACNLYNFMDGADGLAGGMALIGFSALAIVANAAGHPSLAMLCLVVVAASLGFLAWNFPPARVFMGDAGSVPLGFLAGAVSWQGAQEGAWPLAVPLLAFSPFWADATFTLLRRISRREQFWKAHRSHCYQQLVLAGWSHRRLACAAYALMVAAAIAAVALAHASPFVQGAIMLAWALVLVTLAFLIGRRCRALQPNSQP